MVSDCIECINLKNLEHHYISERFGQFNQKNIFLKAQKVPKEDPNALFQWLNSVAKNLLCSGKYQKILENQRNETHSESRIRIEYQNLLGKFCLNLHDGKSLLEAVTDIQHDAGIILEKLRTYSAGQNQIQNFEKLQLLETSESWFVSNRDITERIDY